MASMFFASSSLSVQSLVKLRTNSNYSHSSCYVPSPSRPKCSYVHLSYKNISHIESSKSSFTKGDSNFSFSLPKFPRVSSTLSPSLNIIKASDGVNIYHFKAYDKRNGDYVQLSDRYTGKILLIVNIPTESKHAKSEIELLNNLCKRYENKRFEVLGFLHEKKDLTGHDEEGEDEDLMTQKEILEKANFTIFEKVDNVNNDYLSKWDKVTSIFNPSSIEDKKNDDLWYFLRTKPMGDTGDTVKTIKEEFEKFLVDGTGKPLCHWPRIPTKTMQDMKDGGNPGDISSSRVLTNLTSADILQKRIDECFHKP